MVINKENNAGIWSDTPKIEKKKAYIVVSCATLSEDSCLSFKIITFYVTTELVVKTSGLGCS